MNAIIPHDPGPEDLRTAHELIEIGKAILHAASLAEMRARRAEARKRQPSRTRRFRLIDIRCGWCGLKFKGRQLRRPVIGRYCSNSCKQLAYLDRKRRAAKREAAVAAALAAMDA